MSSIPHSTLPTSSPVLFDEPLFRNSGVRWLGARGFGGLLRAPLADSEELAWVPQYNLKNYWRRWIPPVPVGLIEPLIAPRQRKHDDFDRPPLPYRYNTPDSELFNRNLLAARYYEQEEQLKIWTVSERSKRHYLECFRVEMDKKGHPIPSSQLLISDRKLKMTPPEKDFPDAEHFRREPLLEIRTSIWSDSESTLLFLRSPTLLRMVRQDEQDAEKRNELVPLFNSAIKYFTESDFLNNQLAVVDHGGRVWMHDLEDESPDKPKKVSATSDQVYHRVAFSNHPQLVALATAHQVEIVDIRCSDGSRNVVKLWESPFFEAREPGESKRIPAVPPPPATVSHLEKVPGTSCMYVMVTNHALHLLDERFPGKTVVHVKHYLGRGAHKCIISRGVKDEKHGGVAYSIYLLNHQTHGAAMSTIYLHPSGIWSSVDTFRSLGEPHHFNEAARRGRYVEGEYVLLEPTRAICLLENVKWEEQEEKTKKQSILLRQQDDGAIWWQTLSHDSELNEQKMVDYERQSFRRIRETREMDERWKRPRCRPVYSDGMSEETKRNSADRRKPHRLELPSGFSRSYSESLSKKSLLLLRKTREIQANSRSIVGKLRPQPLDDENSVMSEIVLDHYKQMNEHLDKIHKEDREKQMKEAFLS